MADIIDMKNNPTLTDTLDAHQDKILRELYTCDHGEIVSYDPKTQTASIQPLAKERPLAQEIGAGILERQPLEAVQQIHKVKVIWPSEIGRAHV